ncbi:hypothetical protein, partial [Streptomyces sp. KLOTTS4A1]|uniref:hypothetical protein n=1 Tax=Streptomyces sp. KLOTTS4A1 TaxID=3390996 RepID=UPI0039F5D593
MVGSVEEDGRRPITVHSTPAGDNQAEAWTLHATGFVAPATTALHDTSLTEWPAPGAEAVSIDGVYDVLAEAGFGYGPV